MVLQVLVLQVVLELDQAGGAFSSRGCILSGYLCSSKASRSLLRRPLSCR